MTLTVTHDVKPPLLKLAHTNSGTCIKSSPKNRNPQLQLFPRVTGLKLAQLRGKTADLATLKRDLIVVNERPTNSEFAGRFWTVCAYEGLGGFGRSAQ